MIIRIVKLTLQADKIDAFLVHFDQFKTAIRAAEGCQLLEVYQDKNNPAVFFTYSYWQEERYLDVYRKSETFGQVWPYAKSLFAAPAEAWSVERKMQVV